MVRRLSAGLAVCSVLLQACGSDTPQPSTAAQRPAPALQPSPPARVAESAETEGKPSSEARPGGCDPGCRRLLEGAHTLFRQASALKAESNARIALAERAGEAHLTAWRGCDLRVPGGLDLGCPGADGLVSRMLEAFTIAGRMDRQIFACLVGLDPSYRDAGPGAPVDLRERLRELVEQAEQQGRARKVEAGARALLMAAYGRLALDEPDQAGRDAALVRQRHARDLAEELPLLAAALGSYHVEHESWARALSELDPSTAPGPDSPPRIQILWRAARGRALMGLGRHRAAAEQFELVLSRFQPEHAAELVGRAFPAPMLGREQVVDAIGAAEFYLGEVQRLRAAELDLPAYAGPASVAGVNQYVKTKIRAWITTKQELLSRAEAHYRKIAEIRPVVPARWLVAQAAMTGRAYADFAADFGRAQVPPHLERDSRLSAAFRQALAEAQQPLLARARQSFEFCRKTADQLGVTGPFGASCAEWLEQHRETPGPAGAARPGAE